MSGSIKNALKILGYLSEEPGEPRLLTEIAGSLRIPTASCARILNALAEEKYAEKRGRRGGFLLGPMAYVIASKGPYMKDVAEVAWPWVKKCAESIKEYVVLAARRFDMCYKIVEFDGNPEIRIRSQFVMGGLYGTATARLLLALAGESEIEEYISARGLPGGEWPGCGSRERLREELGRIRKNKFSMSRSRALAAFAYPVRAGGGEMLGLGCSTTLSGFSGRRRDAMLSCVRGTAETIEEKLTERGKK